MIENSSVHKSPEASRTTIRGPAAVSGGIKVWGFRLALWPSGEDD